MATRFGTASKIIALAVVLLGVIFLQYAYDATAVPMPAGASAGFSPEMVRMTDMGFDSTVASFMWAGTMPEILDLYFNDKTEYLTDLAAVIAVDPKLSYPYAFSVLTLPAINNFPEGLSDSFAIGKEGIANADPDWRIPYYMALNYYLDLKDDADAATYFNIAAQTPGVPGYAERFALDFGIEPDDRAKVEALWTTIYNSTNVPTEKARAAAYLQQLTDFDQLEAAARAFKQKYGAYPTSTEALVARGILLALPQDPFGFTYIINPDGTAGIDLSQLPSGFSTSTEDFNE